MKGKGKGRMMKASLRKRDSGGCDITAGRGTGAAEALSDLREQNQNRKRHR